MIKQNRVAISISKGWPVYIHKINNLVLSYLRRRTVFALKLEAEHHAALSGACSYKLS